MKRTINALAPWFGANRLLGEHVGHHLRGCEWVGIPFCGGMSELAHIDARTVLVSDLHRHVLNLARVVADEALCSQLRTRLDATPFHPDILAHAQYWCRVMETDAALNLHTSPNPDWARISGWNGV